MLASLVCGAENTEIDRKILTLLPAVALAIALKRRVPRRLQEMPRRLLTTEPSIDVTPRSTRTSHTIHG